MKFIISVFTLTLTFTFGEFGRLGRFVEGDSNISLRYIQISIEQVSSIHICEAIRMSFIIARLSAS